VSSTTLWVPSAETGISVPTIEHLSIEQVRRLVEKTKGAREISSDRQSVTFKFQDKDNDFLLVYVTENDDQHLSIRTQFEIPQDHFLGATVSANKWNIGRFSHGTVAVFFATTRDGGDSYWIGLQSQLALTGGVTEKHVRTWLNSFLGDINQWEEIVLPAISEFAADSDIGKKDRPDSDMGKKDHPALEALATGLGEAALDWLTSY